VKLLNTITKKISAGIATAAVLVASFAMPAFAAPPAFGLQPGAFGQDVCPGITGKWDSSTGNPAPSIQLNKPCPTNTFAASYVDIITPLEGGPVSALTELNFDYKTGEHCGAGAPRFNIQTETGTAVTLGCASGTKTDAGNGWTHVVFNQAQIAAAVATAGTGTTLQDLYIIFDEGSDTPAGGTIGTPGTVHIDNISVNNQIVGSSTSPLSKDDCKNNGWKNLVGANGQAFKNQGDCVSYQATGGKNPPAGLMTITPTP